MMRTLLTLGVLCAAISAQALTVQEKIDKAGGLVRTKGKGSIAVIDCRPQASSDDLRSGIDAFQTELFADMSVRKGSDFSIAEASKALKASGGSAAVFVVDDPTLPMTLLAAEEKWTLVNVAQIKSDSPTAEKMKHRLSVLFMRQCARVLGTDVVSTPECCTYQVFVPADLDVITSFSLPWGASISVKESLARLGIEQVEMATYKEACEMGIAASPTNDIQKAIWKEVNTPPSNPIKIKFDPAKAPAK